MGIDEDTGTINPGSRCIMEQAEQGAGEAMFAACVNMSCSAAGELLVEGEPCDPGMLTLPLQLGKYGAL